MIDVVLASDETYLPHAATAIHSIVTRSSAVRPHLLCARPLAASQSDRFARLSEQLGTDVNIVTVDPHRYAGLPDREGNRLPVEGWLRCFIPQLFEELERVVYLDADTITVASLDALGAVDLGGHPVGAVRDVMHPEAHDLPNIGVRPEAPYFNSGVLVMDLPEIREHRIMEQVLELGRREGTRLPYGDQDALNAVLAGSWQSLQPRWNVQTSLYRRPEMAKALLGVAPTLDALSDPAVVHFTSYSPTDKPWHVLSRHAYRGLYWRHRRATPWGRRTPEGISVASLSRLTGRKVLELLGRRVPDPTVTLPSESRTQDR